MKLTVYLIFIFLLFLSCSKRLEDQSGVVVISDIKKGSDMLFSQLGSNIEVVQLDNECLMGHINKLAFSKDHIFALDIDQCSCLCSFDRNGHLIKKLDLSSDTKFQFDAVSEMFVVGDELLVHDVSKKSIFYLNESLDVIRTAVLPFMANAIFPYHDIWLVFLNYRQEEYVHDFLVYDPEKGKVLEKFLPFNQDDYVYVYEDRSSFALGKEGVAYFSKAFNDTIYSIDREFKMSPAYYLDLGPSKVPEGYLSKIDGAMDLMQDFMDRKYQFLHGNIHFSKKGKIFAQVQHGNIGKNVFVDPEKNQATLFDGFKDDFLTGITFHSPMLSDENRFVFDLSSEILFNSGSLSEDFIMSFDPSPDNNFLLVFLEK